MKKTKQALIIFNGNFSNMSYALKCRDKCDLLICADGAVDKLLNFGIFPDIVIGDFDSISKKGLINLKKSKITIYKFPKNKNKTDSQLAIELAISLNCGEIIATGLLGDRIDHLFSNLCMFFEFYKKGVDIRLIEGKSIMQFAQGMLKLRGKKGDIVSIIPFDSNVFIKSSLGLQYPLVNLKLPFGSSRGVSNVMTGKLAEIKVEKGKVMVVHTNS